MRALQLLTAFLFLATISYGQCYKCGHLTEDDGTKKARGFKKELKLITTDFKKIKWYNCQGEIYYAVKNYGDSSLTYIFSPEKEYLGKETRYFVTVPKFLDEDSEETPMMVQSLAPSILPKQLWPAVAKIYQLEDLETLNHKDGSEFWVCDIYKVEVPENHIVAQKEGTTIFYVANMDFVFSFFTVDGELPHISAATEYHPSFYIYPENYYEEESYSPEK